MWVLDYKESWARRINSSELWHWRRLLWVPWTAWRSNQSILKEINPGCSLEGLMLKLKLQYFGHLMRRADSFEKTLMLGKIEGRRRRGQQRMRWFDGITASVSSLFKIEGPSVQFSSVQLLSCVWLFETPWTTARQASLSITNSWSPPKPMPIVSVMPSNHLILCRPIFILPSIFPSIRVFSNELALRIRWPKYWSFSFTISITFQWTPRTDLL